MVYHSIVFPRFPPRPFTPAGVKGGFNTQFACLRLA